MQRYLPFSAFLNRYFDGKIQKITIDAGFSCPNRDGFISSGGCIYCNNRSFSPGFTAEKRDIARQMEEGKRFFMRKYPEMKYLAYFQSFTNSYAPVSRLKQLYEEAARTGVVKTGVESTDDVVLRRINRGHDYACAVATVRRTAAAGLPVGIHLILGLPGESADHVCRVAGEVSALPVDIVKLHQLQIIKGTPLAREYQENPACVRLFTVDEYVDVVVDFLERLRPDIVVERFTSQSPADLLLAPEWGLKNYQFVELVKKRLEQRDTWQGRLYKGAERD